MDKRMTPSEVIAQLRDGMTIGIGGWGGRRKPMALVREIMSSSLRDLTIVAYGGPDVGMLCAAGKIKKLIFGFVSLDVIPLEAHFRAARQAGKIEVMEIDEGMLQWGLRAAAMRLPFLPTRAGLGTDVEHGNPEIKSVRSPYSDGETLLAMPALKLDAALLHANQADPRGNCQILGPDPFFDDLFCRAATKAYVSCERIVETQKFHAAGCIHTLVLDRSMVDGVVEVPFGAHPTSCAPDYGIDEAHLKAYSAAAKGDAGFENYYREFLADGQDAYLKAVGGADHISALSLPVF